MNPLPRQAHNDDGSMHSTLFAAALLMLALLLAPQSDAQPRPDRPGGPGQAQQAPLVVPDWVVPGARITQFGSTVQHTKRNRSRDNRWREEDERARQRDIDDGMPMDEVERRARQREEQRSSDRRLYNAGTGGYSYVQYDVVAVTDAGVLMELRYYNLNPNTNNRPELSHVVQNVVYDHATGGGLWVTQDMIRAALESDNPAGVQRVYCAPYSIGEHSYDALAVVLQSGETTIRRIYDTATGIQLYQSQLTDTDDLRSFQSTELAGYRVAELPWVGAAFTDWVQELRSIRYEGTYIAVMPQTPGLETVPDVTYPMSVSFTVDTPADHTLGVTGQAEIRGLGPEGPVEKQDVITPNQRLGLYIAPEVLARLERGQVLDEDPVIGYTIRVTDVYQVDGVTLVEITEQGQAGTHTVVATYDARVGLQVAFVGEHPSEMRRVELNLANVE